jgi:hypothetical protein
MVNEDAPLKGPNIFKAMYWKQYNLEPTAPSKKRSKKKAKK